MLKDGVLVDEQSMTCKTPLRPLLRLDERSERPPPINWLVTSIPRVLEGGGCGSTLNGNDVKLYLMVRFQVWGMWSTPSSPLLPGPHWVKVVVPIRVPLWVK